MSPPAPLSALLAACVVLSGALASYPGAARAHLDAAAPSIETVTDRATTSGAGSVFSELMVLAMPAPAPVRAPAPPPATASAVPTDGQVQEVVTAAALGALADVGGLAVDAAGTLCPATKVVVAWALPPGDFRAGAHIEPLGPAPTATSEAVNGVMGCVGSPGVYAGFEALRRADAWTVVLVPDPEPFGGHGQEHEANDPDPVAVPRTSAARAATPGDLADAGRSADGIEGYASYEPQRTCSPSVKPGTKALRDLLLSRYPSTRSLGITRACDVGGRSEHKEGRAFDWGADIRDAQDRAAVQDALTSMLATDEAGNADALARRMGVMYMIWNRQIWSAYHAEAGWRTYSGSSPHTDHVHISLSWDGARGSTSFWSGNVVDSGGGESSSGQGASDEDGSDGGDEGGGVLGTGLLDGGDGGGDGGGAMPTQPLATRPRHGAHAPPSVV